MSCHETMEEILRLQEKFINANLAFNEMFKEMQLKNLKTVAEQTKDLYKTQIFKDFKYGKQLKNPPWEGKGHIDDVTGETVGAVEEWEKECWDNRKAMNESYDNIHEEHIKTGQLTPWSNPTDIDWKKHFEENKGKGFMSCLDQFLDDPEEEDEEDVA